MARIAATAVGSVHLLRLSEHDRRFADDGIGDRIGEEREAVRLGDKASGRVRPERGIPTGVAAGEVRGANEGEEQGFAGEELGAAAGHSVAPLHRSFSQPLRVEFGDGEPEPGRADRGVADCGGAGLQFEDAGGGDGRVHGADEGSTERQHRGGAGEGGDRQGDGRRRRGSGDAEEGRGG